MEKTRIKNSLGLALLAVALGSVSAGQAQTFTTLDNFANSDGANPASVGWSCCALI